MLSYDDALARILDRVPVLSTVPYPPRLALRSVLGQDVVSHVALPPFDNSAMDGFALESDTVSAANPETPVEMPINGVAAAGSAPATLDHGTAMRIYTGAPVPIGADTIVPIEDVAIRDSAIIVSDPVAPGSFIRKAGTDIAPGDLLIRAGAILSAQHIALLCAIGWSYVSIHGAPVVAGLTTGDEVVEPPHRLEPGQIYNSNFAMLSAQVQDAGASFSYRSRHVKDDPVEIRGALDACETDVHMIVSIGGVSVGDRDYMRDVFSERGTLDFWRVAIRPGKPFAFGMWDDRLFFGLPGNPASAFVTFELFVRPAIRKMCGHRQVTRPWVPVRLSETVGHDPGRRSFLRAVATMGDDGLYSARLAGGQGSNMLRSLADANALLIVPEDKTEIAAGSIARCLLLGDEVLR